MSVEGWRRLALRGSAATTRRCGELPKGSPRGGCHHGDSTRPIFTFADNDENRTLSVFNFLGNSS